MDSAVDWSSSGVGDGPDKRALTGMSVHRPNVQHPNTVAPRIVENLDASVDWKRNGADVQTQQIGLDLTPSISVQPSFRGGPELDPDADWHTTVGAQTQLKDVINTLEPNAAHPVTVAPRQFDGIDAAAEWQYSTTDDFYGPQSSGFKPNKLHPNVMHTREFSTLGADEDWKIPNSSAQDRAAGLLEPNQMHPAVAPVRSRST